MSSLQVTTFEANNVTANVITMSSGVVNSTGIYFDSTTAAGINTTSIKLDSDSIISAISNTPAVNVGGVFYDGVDFNIETVNVQTFSSNGTWTKPSWATTGNELVVANLWGAGGGGTDSGAGGGGGGGAFVFGYIKAGDCDAVCNVEVGIGGTGSASANGTAGGSSVFYINSSANVVAYGGGGGFNNTSGGYAGGGGGGGWFSAGSSINGGGPITPEGVSGTFNGATYRGNISGIFGGASGGGEEDFAGKNDATPGGRATFGGGGGGANGYGISIFGGSGGGGAGGGSTINPEIPGGGGGYGSAQNGADGLVKIYTYRITS